MIFRVGYQAGFEEYAILNLLAATSSYGKHTVCLVCTVCTFSYFSYVGGWCQIKQIASVIVLSEGFNLRYLTLKTDALKKRSVWLTVTEEEILACTLSYLTHEQGRKSKIGQIKIKEHKMGYN